MKGFLHIRIPTVMAMVAAAWVFFACQEPKEEEAGFLVNQQKENSTFSISPEGGDFQLFVVSDVFYNNRSRPGKPVEQAIRESMRDLI